MFSPRGGGQFAEIAPCVLQNHVRRPFLSNLLHGGNGRFYAQLPYKTPALGITAVLPAANNSFMGFNRNDSDDCWYSYSNQLRCTQTIPESRQWNNVGNSSPNFNQAGSFCPQGRRTCYRPVFEGSFNQREQSRAVSNQQCLRGMQNRGSPAMICGDVGVTNERSNCVYSGGRFSLVINLLRHERAHGREPFWHRRSLRNRRARYNACDEFIRNHTKKFQLELSNPLPTNIALL